MTDEPSTDRTAQLEARIAELEARSWRTTMDQGRSGFETAFWATMHRVFPDDARRHLKVAGREQLMAARVYLDKWIERLDEAGTNEEASASREKIDIE